MKAIIKWLVQFTFWVILAGIAAAGVAWLFLGIDATANLTPLFRRAAYNVLTFHDSVKVILLLAGGVLAIIGAERLWGALK